LPEILCSLFKNHEYEYSGLRLMARGETAEGNTASGVLPRPENGGPDPYHGSPFPDGGLEVMAHAH